MEWYLKVLKNYTGFQGRASRQEYWMFFLFNALAVLALSIVGGIIHQTLGLILANVYLLAVLLPSVAVAIRRLHDTGKSGWFVLISLVPAVGSIILLFFLAQEGQSAANQYGSDPRGLAA
ncbi:DUF805 domain-containing protein [Paenibacillus sanguinis]|uniref:DUF805 domain-containing protein n=1 Tax=Paenibacillus sanguinis TaxID=225906 RepID=UPI00035F8EE0|nr:DUF805 domain-containing protein [Paenibacillus sanguinis]